MPTLILNHSINDHSVSSEQSRRANAMSVHDMSRDIMSRAIDWIVNSLPLTRRVNIKGWEPTIHPDFNALLAQLLDADCDITVYSGITNSHAAGLISDMAILPLRWVISLDDPATWSDSRRQDVESTLAALGSKAILRTSVLNGTPTWALALIERHGLSPQIILSPRGDDMTETTRDQYSSIARQIIELALASAERDVRLGYECGIPTCVFTDESLGMLWRMGSVMDSRCDSMLCVTPDGHIIYCEPLSDKVSSHLTECDNYAKTLEYFETRLAPYRAFGYSNDCLQCALHKFGRCHGGCMASNLIGCHNQFSDNQ